MLVIIAAVMAVGFSAFTSAKPLETLAYKIPNGSGGFNWFEVEAERCPVGLVPDCQGDTPHGMQQLYESINGVPVKRQ